MCCHAAAKRFCCGGQITPFKSLKIKKIYWNHCRTPPLLRAIFPHIVCSTDLTRNRRIIFLTFAENTLLLMVDIPSWFQYQYVQHKILRGSNPCFIHSAYSVYYLTHSVCAVDSWAESNTDSNLLKVKNPRLARVFLCSLHGEVNA